MLIVDTGVLFAAADNADPDHLACVEIVETAEELVTTPLVIAEAAHLIAGQLGQRSKRLSSGRLRRATSRSRR